MGGPTWNFGGGRHLPLPRHCEHVTTQDQWCSRDRNLRDRDFIKNSETRDLKFETETAKFVHLLKFFNKMSSSLLSCFFFKFLVFNWHVLVVAHLQIQQTKNHWIIGLHISLNHFFAIFKVWRPAGCSLWDREETWNLRNRDLDTQKWFSRRVLTPRRRHRDIPITTNPIRTCIPT